MKTLLPLSSMFGVIASVLISQSVSAQCLITTTPTNDCSYGDAIDNFTIGTTTATNSGCSSGSGYSAHTTPIFTIDLNVATAFAASVGGANYDQGVSVWIDLDNSGSYEAAEQVYASANSALTHTGTINIPSSYPGVTIGIPLAMRVMCVYDQTIPAVNACTSSQNSYGETEDYTVILNGAVTPPSNVEATAVFEPFDGDCGAISDSVKVTVTNLTATDETNIPVELNLTGAITASYFDTIPSLLGNTSQDLTMAVINTQAGGNINAELIVSLGDDDSSDDTLNVLISILDPSDLVISGDSVVCEGDSLNLSISNASGTETYTWYIDGISTGTGTNFNTGALSISSQVTVESSNGCRANDTTDISVTPLPVLSFTSSLNVGTVDFTGTVINEDSVSWDFGDGNTSTDANPQHTYASNGTYLVCYTAFNSCGAVNFCDSVVVSTIGVEELFLGGIVEVFPNPTSDEVTIDFSASDAFSGKWALYDIDGKLLQSKEVDALSTLNISLGNYPVGTYILKMTSDTGETFRKELMKQ